MTGIIFYQTALFQVDIQNVFRSAYFFCFDVDFDVTGSIGKRYRRQDEIGTPYCITVDFESLEDGCVTVRDRDTMAQQRISMDALKDFLDDKLLF